MNNNAVQGNRIRKARLLLRHTTVKYYSKKICMDGATIMVGRYKGFVSRIMVKQPEVVITHCFLHRETLVVKTLPADLASVLNTVVSIVNFIKTKPLKSRMLSILCEEVGADHTNLLLHTEVRWLSQGKSPSSCS